MIVDISPFPVRVIHLFMDRLEIDGDDSSDTERSWVVNGESLHSVRLYTAVKARARYRRALEEVGRFCQ